MQINSRVSPKHSPPLTVPSVAKLRVTNIGERGDKRQRENLQFFRT